MIGCLTCAVSDEFARCNTTGLPTVFDNVDIDALDIIYDFGKMDLGLTTPKVDADKAPPGSPMMRLRKAFADYLVTRVTAVVTDQSRDEEMITRLLDLKSSADKIVKEAFSDDGAFAARQRDSFATGVNKRENKPPELIGECADGRVQE